MLNTVNIAGYPNHLKINVSDASTGKATVNFSLGVPSNCYAKGAEKNTTGYYNVTFFANAQWQIDELEKAQANGLQVVVSGQLSQSIYTPEGETKEVRSNSIKTSTISFLNFKSSETAVGAATGSAVVGDDEFDPFADQA